MMSLLNSLVARWGFAVLSCIVLFYVWHIPASVQDQNQPQFQLVISHYYEDIYKVKEWVDEVREMPFVKELGCTVTVYTKNKHANLDQIKIVLNAAEVIRLPNVGREQGTYMYHINKTYNHIYPYTMFSQAAITGLSDTSDSPHLFVDWLDESLRYKFTSETKFFNLEHGGSPLFCNCGHCVTGYFPFLSQLQALFDGKICDSTGRQSVSWLGQFIVAKERVVARPRWIYEYIGSLLDAPADHWIHKEQEPAGIKASLGESLPDNPLFGHTVERIWPTLFNCSNEPEMEGCMGSWSPMPEQKKEDDEVGELIMPSWLIKPQTLEILPFPHFEGNYSRHDSLITEDFQVMVKGQPSHQPPKLNRCSGLWSDVAGAQVPSMVVHGPTVYQNPALKPTTMGRIVGRMTAF